MASLLRAALAILALAALATATVLADPSPPQAKANVPCDIGVAPAAPITGAFGIGNPFGDACNAVTDPVLGKLPDPLDPIKDAARSLGSDIFGQITSWAAEGAAWLMGRVAALSTKTTSPNLLSKGFLRQYRQMAQVAAVLAVLMLIFAALEGLGRGEAAMLWRVVLVNVPVAALATSAAYVLVQLLIATTDGFSEVVAHSTSADMRDFFKSATRTLAGLGAATGSPNLAVGVPLFVGFIAASVAALAAFLVWIELLMRDAAIYAVALFMPLALAASIWPRWTGALRRTGELVVVVVFSKFVIVAIIALAASLLANTGGKVEQVLAAGALMLLACFAPFVLFRLVPFAEGAVGSAFNRQSAGGGAVRAVELASSVQMMRSAALANWGAGGKRDDGTSAGGSGADIGPKGTPGGGNGGASGAQAAGASGSPAGAAALPASAAAGAAKAGKAAAGKLADSGTARASGANGSEDRSPRATEAPTPAGTGTAPEPRSAGGGEAPADETKPPRPAGEVEAKDGKGTT